MSSISYCHIAREMLVGDHGVGRVIAKALRGDLRSRLQEGPAERHDFSLMPPRDTMLDSFRRAARHP